MSAFLLESHAHTAEVSPCAQLSSKDVVDYYLNEGYKALIITDHFRSDVFKKNPKLSHNEIIDKYLVGYRSAKDYAKGKMEVFLGLEMSLDGDPNDYLVFGLDEGFLYDNKNLFDMDIKEFSLFVRKNNLLLVQAHPFRRNMRIINPGLLDGIEVYNGNSSHNSSNQIAKTWAENFNLIETSGSDFHYYFRLRPGGMFFETPIKTNAELIEALRSRKYKLKL